MRTVHGHAIPGAVYDAALAPVLAQAREQVPDPSEQAQRVISDMAPRDPAEEMLIAQMLFAHARVMRLTALANQQTGLDAIRVVNEYADRASNTYRRLMLALAEYRRPPRSGDTFAVVKQANIAGQQVIQNHENSTTIATNEQGCRAFPDGSQCPPAIPQALPALGSGVDRAPLIRPEREALDAVHRPSDATGEVSLPAERDKAR
ncbi:MAG: hypothetical protein RBS39_09245 [Phycisphaerales bacterium]|nr:hypothetical protein [Phycisphaerales bacterium]